MVQCVIAASAVIVQSFGYSFIKNTCERQKKNAKESIELTNEQVQTEITSTVLCTFAILLQKNLNTCVFDSKNLLANTRMLSKVCLSFFLKPLEAVFAIFVVAVLPFFFTESLGKIIEMMPPFRACAEVITFGDSKYCNPGNFSKLINLVNWRFWRFINY